MDMNDKRLKKAINKIIEDIQGRNGIGDEYDAIDYDIQAEIRKTWLDIIKNELSIYCLKCNAEKGDLNPIFIMTGVTAQDKIVYDKIKLFICEKCYFNN